MSASRFRQPAGESEVRLRRLLSGSAVSFLVRLFLTLRLSTRVAEAALGVQGHRSWLVGVAAGCVVADLCLVRLVRRRFLRWLPLRLALDTLDAALWAWALHGSPDVTSVVVSPLAAEAGLWLGAAGLFIPAVVGTVVLIGTPASALVYLWPAASVGVGMLISLCLRTQWRARERTAALETEAGVAQAELSGQNSVAMGADSVIDLLARTDPLLRMHEPAPPAFPLSGFKARLAEVSSASATYLQVALLQWQRAHNRSSPDLSLVVEFRIRPGAGTMLLSAQRAGHLSRLLDEMQLSGKVTVDTAGPGVPGREQVVLIGGRPLTLPADPAPKAYPIYPAAVAFWWGALVTLSQSMPVWEAVPLAATIPIATAMLLTGWWINRRSGAGHIVASFGILVAGVVLGGTQAVLTSWLARPDSGRLPFLFFLLWLAPLLGFYLRDLRIAQRALVLGLCLAGMLGGAAAMGVAFSRWWPLAALWPLVGLLAMSGLRSVLDSEAADLRTSLEQRHATAVRDGFRRGRDLVIELTADALEELDRRSAAVPLPAAQAAEISSRLREATDLLTGLRLEQN